MPELPEVEVSRRGLLPFLPGQRIIDAILRAPKLRHEIPSQLSSRLTGLRIDTIQRRGKYLLFDCESRQGGGWLILHLGMSGSLRLVAPGTPPQKARSRRSRLHGHDAAFPRPAPLRHPALARGRSHRNPPADRRPRHRAADRHLQRRLALRPDSTAQHPDQTPAHGQPSRRRHRQHLRRREPVRRRHLAAARRQPHRPRALPGAGAGHPLRCWRRPSPPAAAACATTYTATAAPAASSSVARSMTGPASPARRAASRSGPFASPAARRSIARAASIESPLQANARM
jgi:hypothetical protein